MADREHVETIPQKINILEITLEALNKAIDTLYQGLPQTSTAIAIANIVKIFIKERLERLRNIQKKIDYKPYKRLMPPPPPPPKNSN